MKEVQVHPEQLSILEHYETKRFTSSVAIAFWVFNFLYVTGISLIAGPMLFSRLAESVAIGNAPSHQLGVIVAAILLPVLATGFAYVYRLHKNDATLAEFFVGVELPVASVLLGRSIWAHELTVSSLMLYVFMLAVAVCQAWLLMQRRTADSPVYQIQSTAVTAASAFVAVGGVYLSVLAIIFTSPATVGAIVGGIYLAVSGLAYTFVFPPAVLAIPVGIVVVCLAALALWLACYVPYCFVSQWSERMERTPGRAHQVASTGVLLLFIGGFFMLHSHARSGAFVTLKQDQKSEVVQSELLEIRDEIRTGLVDAYLSPLRYLPQDFGFRTHHPLITLKNNLLGLLLPTLVYQGDSIRDPIRADREYEEFFDVPIQRAERQSILAAHKNHWSPNRELSAGLLDIGQRTVHVESQNVDVEVKQGVATVTVQEVFHNRTGRTLETLQYFTLPEEAVVTGLWLSDTEAQPLMFPFAVAPRGAAQQVYKEQVQIRVDPALLELVGPRQYRLRVFPIVPGTPMVVTMKYETLPDNTGHWPLPALLEQRNVFWDHNTTRTVNGGVYETESPDQWLPQALPAVHSPTDEPIGYRDQGTYVYAEPLSDHFSNLSTKRVVVVVDGSYSMGEHKYALESMLQEMSESDVFFCKDECRSLNDQSVTDLIFYGNSQPLAQLKSFKDGLSDSAYEAVVYLSDGGSYEFQTESKKLDINVPTWLVEQGHGVHAYRDSLLDSINTSGGGIVQSLEQALVAIQLSENNGSATAVERLGSEDQILALTTKHVWFERPAKNSDHHSDELAGIVASLKIKQLSENNTSLEALDRMHDIAVKNGIVSNYSSMIVLVNDQQRQRLKDLSSKKDRFKREVETGKKRRTARVATAVPEPHEWALMALGLLLLLFTAHKQGWSARDLLPQQKFVH